MKTKKDLPTRAQIQELAFKAKCSEHTARRALEHGIDVIKGGYLKERLRAAMA